MTETTTTKAKSSAQLHREWLEHPHFKYRGCAPDADNPLRMAGNPDLHVGAHHGPDAWVAESQKERRTREDAAVEVCLNCPVMVACDAYASSVVWVKDVPKVAEPDGVWGGRRSLERHKALIRKRHAAPVAAPDRVFRTPQKRAVLKALVVCWDPFEVAAVASRWLAVWGEGPVDVRTANWQRSSLVRLLGLPKDSTRMRVLAVARERGLLEDVDPVPDDGTVLAVPPPTKVSAPAVLPLPLPPVGPGQAAPKGVSRGTRPRRRRVVAVSGQMSFDDALAPVHSLFPSYSQLGAAA